MHNITTPMYKGQKDLMAWSVSPLYNGSNSNTSSLSRSPISISVPHPKNQIHFENLKEYKVGNYWKWTFLFILFPFFFWGVPVHLFFVRKRSSTTRNWLKNLFPCWPNPLLGLLSVLLLIVTVCGNGYVAYLLWDLFNQLVIRGKPTWTLVEDMFNLYQTVPVLIPVNYVWLFGFKIKNLIGAFDKITVPLKRPYSNDIPVGVSSEPASRLKLFFMYIMIAAIHSLHVVLRLYGPDNTETSTLPTAGTTKEPSFYDTHNYWGYYIVGPVMYTLILPIYSTLCWAIAYEFQVLASYIGILIEDRQSTRIDVLDDLKIAYKRTADHILQINRICSLYLSWVFPILALSLYSEVTDLQTEVWGLLTNENAMKTPAIVRRLIGDVVVVLLQAILGIFTLWQAVIANDQAKYLHVWLNDLATSQEIVMSAEEYQAFRMLKYYVHSRMEQPQPAMLYLTFLSRIPFMRERMLVYNIYH